MKTIVKAVVICGCVAALVGMAAAKGKKELWGMTAEELKWAEVPDTGGVMLVDVVGDHTKGKHEGFAKFPAGNEHPLHTHSADIDVVVLSGMFTAGPEGGPVKTYGPGSYVVVPAGFKHTSGCTNAGPCVIYQKVSGKFDMKMAGDKKAAK